MFLIFINDLSSVVQYFKIVLFADDFKLFRCARSHEDSLLLREDVDWGLVFGQLFVYQCFEDEGIKIKRKSHDIIYHYMVGGTCIECATHIRNVGVNVDRNLSFKTQVHNLTSSPSRTVEIIACVTRWFLNPAPQTSNSCT